MSALLLSVSKWSSLKVIFVVRLFCCSPLVKSAAKEIFFNSGYFVISSLPSFRFTFASMRGISESDMNPFKEASKETSPEAFLMKYFLSNSSGARGFSPARSSFSPLTFKDTDILFFSTSEPSALKLQLVVSSFKFLKFKVSCIYPISKVTLAFPRLFREISRYLYSDTVTFPLEEPLYVLFFIFPAMVASFMCILASVRITLSEKLQVIFFKKRF